MVLVVAGDDGGTQTASAELYNPATGICSLTAPLAQARGNHTATLLASGQVLIAGGFDFVGLTGLASSEIFEPGDRGGDGGGNGDECPTEPRHRPRRGLRH